MLSPRPRPGYLSGRTGDGPYRSDHQKLGKSCCEVLSANPVCHFVVAYFHSCYVLIVDYAVFTGFFFVVSAGGPSKTWVPDNKIS